MLPKILRIRREAAEPPFLRARASIALVAMIFPALLFTGEGRCPVDPGRRRETCVERASRLLLPNAFGSCAVRALSRGGQEKLRTHVTVRRSRHFVDGADIIISPRRARGVRYGGVEQQRAAPRGEPPFVGSFEAKLTSARRCRRHPRSAS